jgi:hypothetical protein
MVGGLTPAAFVAAAAGNGTNRMNVRGIQHLWSFVLASDLNFEFAVKRFTLFEFCLLRLHGWIVFEVPGTRRIDVRPQWCTRRCGPKEKAPCDHTSHPRAE